MTQLQNPVMIRPLIAALTGLVMLGVIPAWAQTDNPFAAVVTVDEDVITGYEVDQLVQFNALNLGREIDDTLRQEVINYLIDTRVVAGAAEEYGLTVDDAAVAEQLASIATSTGSSVDELFTEYAEGGVDRDTLHTVVHDQILWDRLLRGRYGRQAQGEIDPADVQERIVEYERDQYVEHHIYRISLGIITDDEDAKARAEKLTVSIRKRLAEGESFADIAKRVSRAEDAERGGEIGWRRDTALDDQLQRLINVMAVGAVSTPLYLNDGEVIIVHVKDRRVRTASDAIAPWQYDLQQVHYPLDADGDQDTAEEAIELMERYRTTDSCESDIADNPSLEVERKSELTLADIGHNLRPVVLRLEPGETTELARRSDGLWYVRVCGRTGGVTDAGRERVTAVAEDSIAQERLKKLGEIYLKELRAQATIVRK